MPRGYGGHRLVCLSGLSRGLPVLCLVLGRDRESIARRQFFAERRLSIYPL